MKPLVAIVRSTLRQLLGGRRTILLGLLALIPAFVTFAVTNNVSSMAALRRFHDAPIALLFILVLPIVALVIGAAALGDERRDATITVLVLRPIRREGIVGAKLVGAWLAVTLLVGGGAAAMGIALGITSGRWETVVPVVLGAALSALAYVSVFLLLGYVTPRAVLIGLIYVFVWENAISFAVEGLATVSLFRIGMSAYAGLVDLAPGFLAEPLGALEPGAIGATFKAIGVAAVSVVAGAWLLRRRDIA